MGVLALAEGEARISLHPDRTGLMEGTLRHTYGFFCECYLRAVSYSTSV